MVLECKLHKTLTLITLYPSLAILSELRHSDVSTVTENVDSLVCRKTISVVVCAACSIVNSLSIVKVELTKTEYDPSVT